MVGVRSSQGCKPCRKKKKGCDLLRPSCGQCLKLGAKCAYEDRSWMFIIQQQQYAPMNQSTRLARASLSPSSLLLADQRRQLEAIYSEGHWPSETTSIGDSLRLSSNTHVGHNEKGTHGIAQHRMSFPCGHVYKERSGNATGMSHSHNEMPLGYRLAKRSCEAPGRTLRSVATVLSQVPPTVHAPELWRSSFAQSMAESWFPEQHGYTASLGNNIAYTYNMHGWAPVVAILDALSLLHVGSTMRDENLLSGARRRYVCAIYNLRTCASHKKPSMPVAGLITVAMGILMSEVRLHLLSRTKRFPGP
jgi:hypothetical protein